MKQQVKRFEKNLDNFVNEVYLWLRENREEIPQQYVDDIVSIVNVSQSKLQAIMLDIFMKQKKG